jgi:two-component system, chemotaxis family, sensor kinase CheA
MKGSDPGSEPAQGNEAPERWSLDDVAALLVQLEPTDADELRGLQGQLEDLAFDGGLPPAVQTRVAGAARRVAEAIGAEGVAAAEALRLAGSLLGEAMAAMPEPALRPAVPAEPAPADRPASGVEDFAIGCADASLLPDFITESREYLETAEAALLELEAEPEAAELVNTVFRAFHTIKGTSAFLGLEPISELAHHAESLFNLFRNGELLCTGPLADLSLRAVDMLHALLRLAEQAAGDAAATAPPEGYAELLNAVRAAAGAGPVDPPAANARIGDLLVEAAVVDRASLEVAARGRAEGELLGAALVRSNLVSPRDVEAALTAQRKLGGGESSESSVRVRTDRLDQLIDMVGELVIAQSMVGASIQEHPANADLGRKVTHAGKIVRELQDLSVSLRMVPLRATFQKMARLVRDVARKSGKQVVFLTEGEDTEVDRNMVDIIGDPLVHMIRNAIDHGIESPDARQASGKQRTGTVRLAAYHAGGNVVVELSDDGKGIDRAAILRKAVARGILDAEAAISDSEIFNLIFAPGFSTAATVTDLSGRGVGLDVVRRNVESLRGRVDIHSEAGQGATFSIRLPLTLAVTDGMLVRVGGERYIVPTVNIQMSFRPGPEMLSTVAGRGEMVVLRDELLPIVRLHRLFGIPGAVVHPSDALLVIVGFGEQRCALLVDELLGQHQLVAKSLGAGLGKVPGLSGGAILGDGRVGLILDASEIVSLARETTAGVPQLREAS